VKVFLGLVQARSCQLVLYFYGTWCSIAVRWEVSHRTISWASLIYFAPGLISVDSFLMLAKIKIILISGNASWVYYLVQNISSVSYLLIRRSGFMTNGPVASLPAEDNTDKRVCKWVGLQLAVARLQRNDAVSGFCGAGSNVSVGTLPSEAHLSSGYCSSFAIRLPFVSYISFHPHAFDYGFVDTCRLSF
jgi:hypothetical protein